MQYSFDTCLSPQLANALREFGVDAAYRGHTTDVSWVKPAAQRGLIIVTLDLAPKNLPGKTKLEALALHKAKAIAFYLPSEFARWTRWEQISCFFKYWPAITVKAEKALPGNIFEIDENGRIRRKKLR